ncbi:MAG: CAP domain-containing protein, partial [Chitinophagales bacterium]
EREYDVQIAKLLLFFADDKPVQTFSYSGTHKHIAELIAKNKFSEAGFLLKTMLAQNPTDTATLQLQKQWVIADYKYNNIHFDLSDDELGWTGNTNSCEPGSVSKLADSVFLNTLNYFRRLAGVPDSCILSDSLNRYCQAAAFVMHKNGALSHTLNSKWNCYSVMAGIGAANSNLSLGYHSNAALKGQMDDSGSGNESVGHRRWILNPYRKVFGHGSTTNAMALWALGGPHMNYGSAINDAYEMQYILWPPAGYVPAGLFCSRWSVSLSDADFSNADVRVTSGKRKIPVTVYNPVNGYGLPTLVFSLDTEMYPILDETVYQVYVSGIAVKGEVKNLKYEVRFIQIEP